MRELHKLDDLDPDKQVYLSALQSELDSLRTMNVYNLSDNLEIVNVRQHKIVSSKLIFSKKLHPDGTFDKFFKMIVGSIFLTIKHILGSSDQKPFIV